MCIQMDKSHLQQHWHNWRIFGANESAGNGELNAKNGADGTVACSNFYWDVLVLEKSNRKHPISNYI